VIAVVDYGAQGLRSVIRALAAGGHLATLTADPAKVQKAEHIVLPGVGDFAPSVRRLEATGLGEALRDASRAGVPLMGICLGLQLLFAESEEAPGTPGLAILPGNVRRFQTTLPLPHVGWARVDPTPAGRQHSVLRGFFNGGPVSYYHVHSYHPAGLPAGAILATAEYGESFPTLVGEGSTIGAQFHPEKSGAAGTALLSAFVAWRP
jgi:imidazole glycerol phosphate synthase glutamine amidotransferase subunit